jgi:septal ring factor EnvC (AmiA/AmiB activator)
MSDHENHELSFDRNSPTALFSAILVRLDAQQKALEDIKDIATATKTETQKTNGRVNVLERDRTRAIDECTQCRKDIEAKMAEQAKEIRDLREARIAARWWITGVATAASLLGGVVGTKIGALLGGG